jgi:hypothetical protein
MLRLHISGGASAKGKKAGIKEVWSAKMCALFYSARGSMPLCGNPASRTGSRMAHIIVRNRMQGSSHSSPFKNSKTGELLYLFVIACQGKSTFLPRGDL